MFSAFNVTGGRRRHQNKEVYLSNI